MPIGYRLYKGHFSVDVSGDYSIVYYRKIMWLIKNKINYTDRVEILYQSIMHSLLTYFASVTDYIRLVLHILHIVVRHGFEEKADVRLYYK